MGTSGLDRGRSVLHRASPHGVALTRRCRSRAFVAPTALAANELIVFRTDDPSTSVTVSPRSVRDRLIQRPCTQLQLS